MSDHNELPFTGYLREIDELLHDLPAAQRDEIQRELLSHMEDAAADQQSSVTDQHFQQQVMHDLGSSLDVGTAFYAVHEGETRMLKRVIDICVSSAFLIVFSPLLFLLALAIKVDSRGPILYRDVRMGRYGKPYTGYKFRSMTNDEERKVTRMGAIMRPAMLDELPTAWNVLIGDLSLVGPFPVKPTHANLNDPTWRRVLLARPGLTNPKIYGNAEQQLVANVHYLEHRSWREDLRIFGRALKLIR